MRSKLQPIALRIELLDIAPLIWRRVVVSNQWTLATLHHYVQWTMGWWDTHAHEFRIGEQVVAPDWWIREIELDAATENYCDERRVSVGAIATELGARGAFEYHYDMGDGWHHRIEIETPPPPWTKYELPLPACVAGENACPPEDVGGPPGYERFLSIIQNQNDEEFAETLRWSGGAFDPKAFDLNRINRDWLTSKRRRRE
jgi:hypothetical protein